jgi:hypothetical protein
MEYRSSLLFGRPGRMLAELRKYMLMLYSWIHWRKISIKPIASYLVARLARRTSTTYSAPLLALPISRSS